MAKKSKLSEQTANRLYAMIVDDKEFKPGEKLPNEIELSADLGVSRTTLREAISSLVTQGVLVIHRGRGTFVEENIPENAFELESFKKNAKLHAMDLFEMRLIFEPATVALACQRASDEELNDIRKIAERVEVIAAQDGDWPAADQEFHQSIIRASHNEYMCRLYPIINNAVHEILLINHNRVEMKEIALQDNRSILEFLMLRDTNGAHDAMAIHMRHLLNAIEGK